VKKIPIVLLFVTLFFNYGGCGSSSSNSNNDSVTNEDKNTFETIGGQGATCNPATANWPNCQLAAVPAREHVTNTVHIPGGHYSSPYIADQARTEYILQGDITADSTAITVSASYVVINLNGHTITYNETSPGEGVNIGAWNLTRVAVVNGSIIQGAAMSEGTSAGSGNNPVGNYNTDLGGLRSAGYMHLANLYLKYGGRDVGGIMGSGSDSLIEQNTVEDVYGFGTLKNRHHVIKAIRQRSSRAIIRNNTIINARQAGIDVRDDSQVYGNHVTLRSIDTNSSGIGGYKAKNVTVYNNTIIGKGVHPIGIGFLSSGTDNIEIYNNSIDLQVTMLGREYGDDMFASGFRTTWGGNNIKFYNNEIHIATDTAHSGHWADTGAPVTHQSRGKGLFVGIPAGETALFLNNHITFSGSGAAYGIAPSGNASDALFVVNNTIETHDCHVVLEDSYSGTRGFPLFMGNHFIRTGNNPNYYTIGGKLGGYNDQTARFVDNIYSGGASLDSINLHPSGRGIVSVYFGTVLNGEYRYNYRLHDNDGASSTLLRDDFNPPRTLNYAVPGEALEFLQPPAGLKVIVQ